MPTRLWTEGKCEILIILTWIWIVPAPNILFLWSMKLYSERTTGKMGKPESMATWKAPFLNGNIWNKNNKQVKSILNFFWGTTSPWTSTNGRGAGCARLPTLDFRSRCFGGLQGLELASAAATAPAVSYGVIGKTWLLALLCSLFNNWRHIPMTRADKKLLYKYLFFSFESNSHWDHSMK